jgi:hypothetical protein
MTEGAHSKPHHHKHTKPRNDSSIEIGRQGENQAGKLLIRHGWHIIERGNTKTPWDIRAERKGDILCINVKNGKKTNSVGITNLTRLMESCLEAEIPALMFMLEEDCYILLSLEEAALQKRFYPFIGTSASVAGDITHVIY